MLLHYLKIAFRNMWKYKMQSVVSIVGLAMGFICFALAMLWIRYEMSYDKFHRDAERIYVAILLALVLIIVLSVGWQVYQTSIENPAEVVKKE
jgi:uncharacterized membrane protein